jgi:hypothetical protein
MRLGTWMGIGLFAVAGLGCGGGSSKPASYNQISASFAHPTGTLAATNADAVAQAYQASLSSGLDTAAGRRLAPQTSAQTVSEACPNGGTIAVNVNQASANAISESYTYNNCCETADCCVNGGGNLFYSASGSSSGSFCEAFQISATCSGQPVSEDFSICEDGSTGMISYLVEVDGLSFAVSGSYSSGTGTLTITGANGTFTCTYTNNTGSCTGTSGSFTF